MKAVGLVIGFLLLFANALFAAEPLTPKGADDLLRNDVLSRPFTVFDQLLLGMDQKAARVARAIRPENNDYRPSTREGLLPSGHVFYDEANRRTMVEFAIWVRGVEDPWRETCARRVRELVGPEGMLLPRTTPNAWPTSGYTFFPEFLGPRLTANDSRVDDYKSFSDSIAVSLFIIVESGNPTKPLKYHHTCTFDNKTGQIFYRDHQY
jgi:hypothetical protein